MSGEDYERSQGPCLILRFSQPSKLLAAIGMPTISLFYGVSANFRGELWNWSWNGR
jgi:hypothetical protein